MNDALRQGLQPQATHYIHRIIVGRFWQGQALFAPMLAWCEGEVRRLQLDRLRLDTWADNRRWLPYYASFGFIALGERTASTGQDLSPQYRGVRLVIMERQL